MENIIPLLPLLGLATGLLMTMLISIVRTDTKRPAQIMAFITFIVSGVMAVQNITAISTELPWGGLLEASSLTSALISLFSFLGAFFTLGFSKYLSRENLHLSDYYHLLILVVLGASVLVSSKDLVLTFIALELMSLPAYTLVGFRRNDPRSNEAAIKYFIMGGALGAVFLMGSAYLFGATGATQYERISQWTSGPEKDLVLFQVGHILILIAFMFKAAAVPFHFWKPDVYEGAPTPVTGVMATVITTASFVTLLRLVHLVDFQSAQWAQHLDQLKTIFRVSAGLSLIIGSAIMITQKNLKRLMAYSSISHSGYMLLGVLGSLYQAEQYQSVLVYLIGYSVMSAGMFILISQSERSSDLGVELIDLTGLVKRDAYATILWSVLLFSMAGMPLTVGFFAKYSVFVSAMSMGEVGVVITAAVCTVVSAYAYLRPIALMTMRDADPTASTWSKNRMGQITATLAVVLVLILGIKPNAMLHLIKGIPLIH